MKKIIFGLVIVSFNMTSCKKDYSCVCNQVGSIANVVVTTEAKLTKSGAKAWCKENESPVSTINGTIVANPIITCVLN